MTWIAAASVDEADGRSEPNVSADTGQPGPSMDFSPGAGSDTLSTGRWTVVIPVDVTRQARQMESHMPSLGCWVVYTVQLARVGWKHTRLWAAAGCIMFVAVTLASGLVGEAAVAKSSVRWVWPLLPTPEVVRAFDPPDEPWLPGHRGVDLSGDPDQAVRAAGAGQVTFAGMIAGVGVIVLDHGALRTTYQPVHPTVGVGDTVAAGDVIGRLRVAGGHCLPSTCLHWGLLRGNTYLNPLLLVGGGPVRLLPLSGPGLVPGPPPADPARGSSTPSIQGTTLDTPRWAANKSPESAAGRSSQASRPQPSARRTRRTPPRSDSSDGGTLPWAGWMALSAVGAGLSLRSPIRRALARGER
jgi:murein DD-endopeptidase MepM/ murein hydrolase activator NlpD